ncbi:hypothetical protein OPV09_22100 [Janthinobacterium sp. TB1-E2]|uniref:Nucleoside 2-deoxyribosyltransferase n=1 Tax=Janthinobacterium aestuarii TaxID=2985511 RepID=A0ABZ2GHV9_9BURK
MTAKKHAQISTPQDIEETSLPEECFVIMPISDQLGYDSGHFAKVYEDIFKPACQIAGYKATRADDVKESNLIHLDILKRVVHSPMAICDLSSRNPNVLFELGLRQAFDKPTILVKDADTQDIFDIAPIRYTTYHKTLRYREVLEDQKSISDAIRSTRDAAGKPYNVNSLIKLLELSSPAKIIENGQPDPQGYFQVLMAEITQLRRDFRSEKLETGEMKNSTMNYNDEIRGKAEILRKKVQRIQNSIATGSKVESLEENIVECIELGKEAIIYYNSNSKFRAGPRQKSVENDLIILENLHIQCLL